MFAIEKTDLRHCAFEMLVKRLDLLVRALRRGRRLGVLRTGLDDGIQVLQRVDVPARGHRGEAGEAHFIELCGARSGGTGRRRRGELHLLDPDERLVVARIRVGGVKP